MEGGKRIKTALLMVSLAWYMGCALSVYIVLAPSTYECDEKCRVQVW